MKLRVVGVFGVTWPIVSHRSAGGATVIPTAPGVLVTLTVEVTGGPFSVPFRRTVVGFSVIVFCPYNEVSRPDRREIVR